MKNLKLFNLFLLTSLLSFLLVSCTDDGSITQGPRVSLGTGLNVISSDASVDAGKSFSVNITGVKGDADLRTLTIQEAGVNVPLERLTFSSGGGANPLLLSQANPSSFDITVDILAHLDISAKIYSFIVEDAEGEKSSVTLTITTMGNPPLIENPVSNAPLTINPGQLFSELFIVKNGTTSLNTVEVSINDASVTDLSQLFYGDLQTPFTSNPLTIPMTDINNFNKNIFFRAPNEVGIYIYKVKFTDLSGLSSEVLLPVTVGKRVTSLEGVLFNQAGPVGRGGLDLDTGVSTGSSNASAEIRDEGIDLGRPVANNWRQQISGINGSEIKSLVKGENGLSENFSFEDIVISEQLLPLWQNGKSFTQKSSDGMRDVSDVVVAGDIFVVKNGDKYYLILVRNVVVTSDDNTDNYVLDIKF